MNSSIQQIVIGLFAVAVSSIVLSSTLTAQDRGDRGDRGGFDFSAYLGRLDTNKNGQLDPNEISGRTESWLKREGYDVSKPVSVKKLVEKVTRDRERRGSDRDRDRRSESSQVTLKVPAFGAEESPVPAFGPSDVAPLAASFSDSVKRQVDQTLERYDSNNNGMLDRDELKKARWGSPRPEESDTNGDGRLSRTELSNRYYAREQYRRDSESKTSTSSSRDSGDRSDYRSRYSRGSSSDRGSSSSSRTSSSGRDSSSRSSSSRSSYTPSRSSSSSSSGSSSSASRDKYASYAESLIKNYDEDKDGKLSKDEVKKMRRPPVGADQDGDGSITQDELIDSLSGANKSKSDGDGDSKSDSSTDKKSSSSSPSSRSSRYSSSRSRGSFSGLDANEDNQVQMHEFSDEWDDEKVEEFYEKDKNGDGVITLKEWNEK